MGNLQTGLPSPALYWEMSDFGKMKTTNDFAGGWGRIGRYFLWGAQGAGRRIRFRELIKRLSSAKCRLPLIS
jgi:hypothetical protein